MRNDLASRSATMPSVWVRYFVRDVEPSIEFYTRHLGFKIDFHPGPGFAALSRGELQLLLSAVSGGGGAVQATPGGERPQPGGWNRIQLRVADLEKEVEALRQAGVQFRNQIVIGNGGAQILLQDPAGNPIELFEPRRA
jgi:catechol 2,3-dioxygenase-like lactoylglutathione lyase family enzyme